MTCNHKRWHAGKMIDLVDTNGEEQIWQEGWTEKTVERVSNTLKRCSQCGDEFESKGISATDIKRKTDGTRVTQVYSS